MSLFVMVQVTSKLQMSRLSFDSVVVAVTFKPDAPIVYILPKHYNLIGLSSDLF